MSTRGAVGFVADGKWYVTYNHSDSYPSCLGMEMLEFCKSIGKWSEVKEKVRKLKLVAHGSIPTDDEVRQYLPYYNRNVGNQNWSDWYCLLREAQGVEGLRGIIDGKINHMIDNHTFLGDSLFCEWAYIIDLDEMLLRVYKGFNTKPIEDESTLPVDVLGDFYDAGNEKYYAVRMLHAYRLNRLPEFMLGVTNKFKEAYRKAGSLSAMQVYEIAY